MPDSVGNNASWDKLTHEQKNLPEFVFQTELK